MTGFSSVQFYQDPAEIISEIRTVNHRYFDLNFYFPPGFGFVEEKAREIVSRYIKRGRISVALKIVQKNSSVIFVDKNVVKAHLRYANELKKEFKLTNDLTLSDVIKLPGVVSIKEPTIDPQALWPAIEKNLVKILKSLDIMRQKEGKSIVADISKQLKTMKTQAAQIRNIINKTLKQKQAALTEEEYKSFEKNANVNEELSRLAHHVDQTVLLLKSNEEAGKKMDFIAQEMQRETNTIGSKFQDKIVSNLVVNLKSTIENIREQAQNIE